MSDTVAQTTGTAPKPTLTVSQAMQMARAGQLNTSGKSDVSEAARTLGQQSAAARAQRAAAAPTPQEADEAEPQTEADPQSEPADATEPTDAVAAEAQGGGQPEDSGDAAGPQTITIDGVELSAEEIRRGYLRRADHSRAMNKLGDEKRAIHAERSEKLARLSELVTHLEASLPKPPDAELRRTDPIGYLQAKEDYAELLQALDHAKATRRAESERQLVTAKQAMFAQLQEQVPEWGEPRKLNEGLTKITEYMIQVGTRDETLSSMSDPTVLLAFDKARKWDDLQKAKPELTKRVAGKPQVIRPGARVNQQSVGAKQAGQAETAFKQQPNLKSAMAFLQARREIQARSANRSTVA